jgi:hypothetical protein
VNIAKTEHLGTSPQLSGFGVYQDPSHYFRLSQPHAQWRADFPGFVSAIGILQQLAHLARFKEYILVLSEIVGLERPTQ